MKIIAELRWPSRTAVMLLTLLMLTVASSAWGWQGSGTESDPYLINNVMDWRMLVSETKNGSTYDGGVFRLTADLSVGNFAIGTEDTPFSGTFDGDGHTLTFSAGTGTAPSADRYSPFLYASGATIRISISSSLRSICR